MAITLKKTNFAKSTLAESITSTNSEFDIFAGDGAKFPSTGVSNIFRAVIWDASYSTPEQDSTREIVEAYRSVDDTLVATRAQESTSAKAWNSGDRIALVLTAATLLELETEINTKAPSTSPTFATSITGSYLTASEILITDADKKIISAPVASYPSLTELTYVKGVTSAIQTQLGTKVTSGGALGTPSSGTGTNITGIPAANILAGSFGAGAYVISTSLQVATIELGHATDTTLSRSAVGVLAVEGVVIPSISSTNTLTNKRITKRTGTATSSATPTINTDNVDFYSLTAQAVDITSFTTNLSGTPTENQTLWIAITGTAARAITWGASFEASTVALPTTTVTTARLDVGFVWNTVTSKWRCVATS